MQPQRAVGAALELLVGAVVIRRVEVARDDHRQVRLRAAQRVDEAADERALRAAARSLGVTLEEPLLQLAFLALPVIPALKITDRGMVDVTRFEIIAG